MMVILFLWIYGGMRSREAERVFLGKENILFSETESYKIMKIYTMDINRTHI